MDHNILLGKYLSAMTKETTTFVLLTGDKASVELMERNHGVVCVIPTVTLAKAVIPPTLFQEILEHIISLKRDYIKKIYFDNVRIVYRFIKFQLFGHIRGALREELRTPLLYSVLVAGDDDYKWIQHDFLPKFPDEFDDDIKNLEGRINNMYRAFKRGKVGGIPYVLPEEYEIVYNYSFELDDTDIKPIFVVYVNTKPPISDGDDEEVSNMLLGKFKSLDVNMVFR